MSRFLLVVTKAWFLTLVLALTAALVVWFFGPLIDNQSPAPWLAPVSTRLWVVFAILSIWMVAWAIILIMGIVRSVRIAKAHSAAEKSGDTATAPSPPKAGAEDIQQLAKRFDEAVATLKKVKGAGFFAGQYLYASPWYMFIGAPGSGKTTALVNSGLRFPLSESIGKNAVRGVGGTRNCDWWFTDEAVLLDTAGRYATQDSEAEADSNAWLGFLKLLKKNRKRRPINGAILTVSVADLLSTSDQARLVQAQAIRERIKELHDNLGIQFPIYLMVTKCDLLAGFSEYFDHMGKTEREQVLGHTFSVGSAADIDALVASVPVVVEQLSRRLGARTIQRMEQERDPARRALILAFPRQFASLQEPLSQFVLNVFGSSRFDRPALLRGFYFTSGTQLGNPIDRVVANISANLGIDRNLTTQSLSGGKSFFISKMLHEVMFKESGLAGSDLKLENKVRWVNRAVAIVLAMVAIGFFAGMGISYFRNRAYVDEVELRLAKLDVEAKSISTASPLSQTLGFLSGVRELPGGYADQLKRNVPMSMRFGLYQGDKLGYQAVELYERALREIILPRVVSRIEDELNRGLANNSQALIEALRVYLMLGDSKRLDPGAVVAWFDFDVVKSNPRGSLSPEQLLELTQHHLALATSLKEGIPVAINAQTVTRARDALAKTSHADRVYASLRSEIERSKLSEFSVANAAGPNAAIVLTRTSGEPLTRGVSGLFTVAGYKRFVKSIDGALTDVVKDNWIYGKNETVASLAAAQALKTQVLELYYADYIKAWDKLLADVVVMPFSSLDAGARIVNILANPSDSPIKKFWQAAAKETTLGDKKQVTLSDTMKGELDSAKKNLMAKLGAEEAPSGSGAGETGHPVDVHFDRLRRTVGAGGEGNAPVDQDLAVLKDAFVFFDAAAAAKRQGSPPPPADVLTRMKRDSVGKPAPIAALLAAIGDSGSSLSVGGERSRLSALWRASVGQFCRSAVSGRYPLVASATQEVTQEDFGRLFSSGGLIDDFFQKNLIQLVDMSSGRWVWRAQGNVQLGIPQSVLDEFYRASLIRDSFFPNRATLPTVRFDLRPLGDNSSIQQFVFELDGQSLQVSRGQGQAKRFQWPSGSALSQARFEFPQNSSATARGAATEGQWALFRLLEKGVLSPTAQPERFQLSFENQGKRMVLELSASSVSNPFKLAPLRQFRCLDQF
jgi:type VI secretion system protein ImpL